MIRINLLPIKAVQRQASARNEMFAMAGLVVLTLAALYLWYSRVESEIEELRVRTSQIDTDIARLNEEVKQVEVLQRNEKTVTQKLKVINQLMANKVGPARMLDEIATIMTHESKRVWLTKLSQKDNQLTLVGGAMDHEDVSEFQLALERRDTFVEVKLKRVTSEAPKKGGPPYLTWELTCTTVFKGTG